ncbi:DNA gyrase-like protein, partial [Sulfolobus spindle-shaped virus 1]
MAKKNGLTELEQLKKENEELRKKLEELEALINNDSDDDEELQEIENPYTVTNRAIDELVSPKDTMFYLSGNQISLILSAFE